MADGGGHGGLTLFTPRDTLRFRYADRAEDEGRAGYTDYAITGPVTVAFRRHEGPGGAQIRDYLDAGKNPPNGVLLHYAFAEKPEGEVKLEILDGAGKVIRAFSSAAEEGPKLPAEAGANRFVWNLREEKVMPLLDETRRADSNERGSEDGVAPRALPGEYTARLTLGETRVKQRFTIL